MKIANTSLERSASLVFIRKLSNKLNALQLHWRLPNSARNLAEAEFGKNGRISNLPKPKFGATLVKCRCRPTAPPCASQPHTCAVDGDGVGDDYMQSKYVQCQRLRPAENKIA